MVFDIEEFEVEPAQCGVSYTCTSVRRIDTNVASRIRCADLDLLDNNGFVVTFSVEQDDYLTNNYPPGDYEVTITGTAGRTNQAQETTKFVIKLIDPCDPPSAITAP